MHLAQHHFQAQSRYFEDSIHFADSNLFFKPYGVAGVALDAEALRNGTVSLLHAHGVMPDGLTFHMPDGDPLPAPQDIAERFSPTEDSQLVLLTIPAHVEGGENSTLHANGHTSDTRYVADTRQVVDETTGRDTKPITVGRKNFRLTLDSDATEGTVALPLARVRRDGLGGLMFDSAFVPPCLSIGASDQLMQMLVRLVEMLDAKSDALSGGARSDRRSPGEYSGHEVATFWLLHAIHSSVATLRHHLRVRRTSPEQLFTELSRLAGALCTFALDAHPRTLPLYDHDHLSECFDALDAHIRSHLEVVIPTNCVTIPLTQPSAYLHTGPVTDRRCFDRAHWILGIRSTAGGSETVSRVPQLVKVCSSKFVLELVRRAYPGLVLEHLPVPPAAISPRIGTQYFSIAKAGPCWDTIVQTAEVGIYVPDALPEPQVELLVLLES
jgi:type VI secretion system protein ImpJ